MTWDEFKKNVDDYLKGQGKTGAVEIAWIDFSAEPSEIHVIRDTDPCGELVVY
jgi:hypothetical protein